MHGILSAHAVPEPNLSLVGTSVAGLTTAKFKLPAFPALGYALSSIANIVIVVVFYHFCFFPA
jgi:hypothetical protein